MEPDKDLTDAELDAQLQSLANIEDSVDVDLNLDNIDSNLDSQEAQEDFSADIAAITNQIPDDEE